MKLTKEAREARSLRAIERSLHKMGLQAIAKAKKRGGGSVKLTTFDNEVECVTHNHETLVIADVRGKRTFVAVTRDGFRTDYPIFYSHSQQTAWDNPEWFSQKFKDKVHAHFLTAWKD